MKFKKLISFTISILLAISFSIPAFATGNDDRNASSFKDVQKGYWAYDQIMWMLGKKIIEGTGNGYFSPDGLVTRSQFAKMMVLTLNLQLYYPNTPSFLDVGKNAWEYPYVESAKSYLTGFRTSQGDNFKPSQPSVREDMAVALVKAMGFQNETADESILNRFADAGQISPNLRKYIALSVKHGLIEGYTQNGQTVFNPQGNLTRAQASTLLYKAFKTNEDKVTYEDGSKVTYDDNSYIKPDISVSSEDGKLAVKWKKIGSSLLRGYMVIVSKNDSTPTYPENGFLYYFTDVNKTSAVIDNSTAYSGTSDFGKYLEKGKNYYISVSAVYTDRYVAGDTVRKTYNGPSDPTSYTAPVVSASIENWKLVLRWNRIDSSSLKGYRVVVSKNDSSPNYPDNGYLYSFTDRNTTSAVIDNRSAYNGTSDFGQYLTKGQAYYFTVTAVYDDRNITGNTIQYVYPGNGDEYLYPAPTVSSAIENGKLVLKWNKLDHSYFKGYRIVISRNDSTPSYPDNGYLSYITDRNTTSVTIDNSTAYNGNSDFGKYLVKDQAYYFSVTAVYDDKTVAGNAVQCVYPGNGEEKLYPAPVVYTVVENGNLVVRWGRITSDKLQNYRVVISKNSAAPKYPENGYLYKITDRNRTFAVINNADKYNSSDFGEYLTKGETYYFSVTAVYNDRTVAGNAVQYKYDGNENPQSYVQPTLSASEENGRLVLRWNKIDSSNLQGYRIVASKNDSTPGYPENGSLYWITDRSKTYAVLESNTAYSNGDFGPYLIKGEKYFFSVTAVYNDKNITSNVVQAVYNGDDNPALFPSPAVTAAYENGNLIVKWNKIDSPQLAEYRIVISQGTSTPAYPANGFYNVPLDINATSAAIDVSKPYSNGDFKTLTDGTEYYFSVTAVYNYNKYKAGNAVKVLFVLPPKQ
jgi:hypothetical protein